MDVRTDADRFDGEQDLIADLRRLAADTVVPPIDPVQEQQLLEAFDRRWSAPARRWYRRPVAAAGLLAAAASVALLLASHSQTSPTSPTAVRPVRPQSDQSDLSPTGPTPVRHRSDPSSTHAAAKPAPPRRRQVGRPIADSTFVMWPGARDLPRFESGQLMRVELPASVASSLGLRPPQPSAFVQTDVLVGQDGYARAVRLVQ